jgi:hypothetical protein
MPLNKGLPLPKATGFTMTRYSSIKPSCVKADARSALPNRRIQLSNGKVVEFLVHMMPIYFSVWPREEAIQCYHIEQDYFSHVHPPHLVGIPQRACTSFAV